MSLSEADEVQWSSLGTFSSSLVLEKLYDELSIMVCLIQCQSLIDLTFNPVASIHLDDEYQTDETFFNE